MIKEQLSNETQTEEETFNPDNVSEKIIDHIAIYENAFIPSECDELISKFDELKNSSYTFDGKDQFKNGLLMRFHADVSQNISVAVLLWRSKKDFERNK